MKIILYNNDGSINKELECLDCLKVVGNWYEIILERDVFKSSIKRSMVSNLPFVLSDNTNMMKYRQPEETDPKYKIALLSDTGLIINTWNNAKGLSYTDKYINFKTDDKWNTVLGNVLIENIENE